MSERKQNPASIAEAGFSFSFLQAATPD